MRAVHCSSNTTILNPYEMVPLHKFLFGKRFRRPTAESSLPQTQSRPNHSHHEGNRTDSGAEIVPGHDPIGSTDKFHVNSTAEAASTHDSPTADSPQNLAYRESRITQLAAEIQSRLLAEQQTKREIQAMEQKNLELCRSIRDLELTTELEQKQHTEQIRIAEADFFDRIIGEQSSSESKLHEKEQSLNAEIADQQNLLIEKTENELQQNQLAKKYRTLVLGLCRRMRTELREFERQKEADLQKARREKLELVRLMRDAQVKNASLMVQIAERQETEGDSEAHYRLGR